MKSSHLKRFIGLLLGLITPFCSAEEKGEWVSLDVQGYPLKAHYLKPNSNVNQHNHAVLIIAGSGATDHNGNNVQMGLINNSYQMMAEAFQTAGYAVLRPDKRGVGMSHHADFKMAETRFHHYVQDVTAWIRFLRDHHQQVTVIGHSLGGLMSIQAAQEQPVDHLVALASVANSGYATIKRQMGDQPEFVNQAAIPLLDRLAQGETIAAEEVPPFLNALLHPDIQPYMQSFMLLEPRSELAKLNIPSLVLVGDHDIQITVKESEAMAQGLAHVTFKAITGMNHVLKSAPEERMANIATYSKPDLPLHPELMPALLAFLQGHPETSQ